MEKAIKAVSPSKQLSSVFLFQRHFNTSEKKPNKRKTNSHTGDILGLLQICAVWSW